MPVSEGFGFAEEGEDDVGAAAVSLGFEVIVLDGLPPAVDESPGTAVELGVSSDFELEPWSSPPSPPGLAPAALHADCTWSTAFF